MTRRFAAALVLLLAGCFGRTDALSATELQQFQACAADADCAIVANGCCCGVAAISVAKQASFDQSFDCAHATQICDCAPRPPEHAACVAASDGVKRCTIVTP
jgi:hypothetical protein